MVVVKFLLSSSVKSALLKQIQSFVFAKIYETFAVVLQEIGTVVQRSKPCGSLKFLLYGTVRVILGTRELNPVVVKLNCRNQLQEDVSKFAGSLEFLAISQISS